MRYVVLHHTGHGEPHFDLMIERDADGPLATWRLPAWPPSEGMVATPLPDHRRVYLQYEGPVSGGRGEVRRVATGQATGDATFIEGGTFWAIRDGTVQRD